MTTMEVYIMERVFELKIRENNHGTDPHDCWLGFIMPSGEKWNGTLDYAMEWLSSPQGIHTAKQAMIERGYDMFTQCRSSDSEYWVQFQKPSHGSHGWLGKIEAEAVINATYKALKSEED